MLRFLLLGAIALLVGLQASLALGMAINWDEFYFLSQVHAQARGALDIAINSFHVHLFQWLRLIPGDEISQVVAGRLVMLTLEAATVVFLIRIARCFMSLEASLAAGVAYLTFSFVLAHGASFRTDPAATALCMGALWLMVCSDLRRTHTAAIGVLLGLAALITIKSAFYLPTLAVAALWRLRTADEPRRVFINLALGAVVGAVVSAALFLWHASGLQPSDSVALAASAYDKTIGGDGLFPRAWELRESVRENLLGWVLLTAGVITAASQLRDDRLRAWVLASLAFPLLSFVFYRNAFPYFFAFVLAPASVLAGLAFERWVTMRAAKVVVIVGLLLGAGVNYVEYASRSLAPQRAVVATVHRMFPQPTPYIERAFMIGSFPHAGFFMTTWGMDNYRQAGRPVLKNNAASTPPVFVIATHEGLEAALQGTPVPAKRALLPKDAAFLRENFIPHWGPIWVAGKRIEPADGTFEIVIPGRYTVEGTAPVQVDGRIRQPGEVLELASGSHTIDALHGAGLRWGERLYRPGKPPPEGSLYTGF